MAYTWTRDVVVGVANDAAPAAANPAPPTVSAAGPDWDSVGTLLVTLFTYFTTNLERHPGLVPAAGAMSDAIHAYGSRLGGDPYGPVTRVVDLTKTAQQSDPSIPAP